MVAFALEQTVGLLTKTFGGDTIVILSIVVPEAHCPGLGVKVYVVVPTAEVLIVAGLQVPAMLLLDVAGNAGAVAFRHKGAIGEKFGVTEGLKLNMPEADVL